MGPYKPLRTWVDDHPLLYGNNGSVDAGTHEFRVVTQKHMKSHGNSVCLEGKKDVNKKIWTHRISILKSLFLFGVYNIYICQFAKHLYYIYISIYLFIYIYIFNLYTQGRQITWFCRNPQTSTKMQAPGIINKHPTQRYCIKRDKDVVI